MLGGGPHLELLELVRFIQLVGNSLSQEGVQLMSLEDPPPRPLHYIPETREQTEEDEKRKEKPRDCRRRPGGSPESVRGHT